MIPVRSCSRERIRITDPKDKVTQRARCRCGWCCHVRPSQRNAETEWQRVAIRAARALSKRVSGMAHTKTEKRPHDEATQFPNVCALSWLTVSVLFGCLLLSTELGVCGEPLGGLLIPAPQFEGWMKKFDLRDSKSRNGAVRRTNRFMNIARQMLADAQRSADRGDFQAALQLAMRAERLADISARTTSITWFSHEQQPAEFIAGLEARYGLQQPESSGDPIRLVQRELPLEHRRVQKAEAPPADADRQEDDVFPETSDSPERETVAAMAESAWDLQPAQCSNSTGQPSVPEGPANVREDLSDESGIHHLMSAETSDCEDDNAVVAELESPAIEPECPAIADEPAEVASLEPITVIESVETPASSDDTECDFLVDAQSGQVSELQLRPLDVPIAPEPKDDSQGIETSDSCPAIRLGMPSTPTVVPVVQDTNRSSASLLLTVVLQFCATVVGLLAGVAIFAVIRLYVLKRYGTDIGNLIAPVGLAEQHATVSDEAAETAMDDMSVGCTIPFPIPAPGRTYADRRADELKALKQKEAAILKHVFEQNLKLREQLRGSDGSVAG